MLVSPADEAIELSRDSSPRNRFHVIPNQDGNQKTDQASPVRGIEPG